MITLPGRIVHCVFIFISVETLLIIFSIRNVKVPDLWNSVKSRIMNFFLAVSVPSGTRS